MTQINIDPFVSVGFPAGITPGLQQSGVTAPSLFKQIDAIPWPITIPTASSPSTPPIPSEGILWPL